jgi:glycosyltransferase involved in cell wall biosynthesis
MHRKLQNVDAFTSPSAFSAEKHREFGFERELEVIPYFLPDLDSGDEIEDHSSEDRPDSPYFLFVGRLEKIKGLQDVLPQFGPGAPADLFIVGTGEYEQTLRRLAIGRPHVQFLGSRTSEQLRRLYRNALAVIVPSVCFETFGIILIEAFRDRTPVVARALGPMTEIVRESGGGLLFETTDQLGAALRRLATDASLRSTLANAGHAALRERWTESVVLRQYFNLIRRVARDRGLSHVLDVLGPLESGMGERPLDQEAG